MNVELVRWPAESDRREQLVEAGVPLILVVEGWVEPPVCTYLYEDWVRPPISREDLQARRTTLLARAVAHSVPVIDPDDVLRFGHHRLCLSPAEAQLMRALVGAYGSVVDRSTLVGLLWPGCSTARRNALDLRILRLRRRIMPLQLTIRTVWGRGYMIEANEGPTLGSRPLRRSRR